MSNPMRRLQRTFYAVPMSWGKRILNLPMVQRSRSSILIGLTLVFPASLPGQITVVDRPDVEVGRDGSGSTYFTSLVDASLLPDGSLIALDGSTPRILVLDAKGALLVEVGREGDGPAEFRRPMQVWLENRETIGVFDAGSQRVSRFDLAGELLSDEIVSGPSGRAGGVGLFADGGSYVRESDAMGSVVAPDLMRDTVVFATLSETGHWRGAIARVPGQFVSRVSVGDRVGFRPAPLTPRPIDAAWGRTHGRGRTARVPIPSRRQTSGSSSRSRSMSQ